MAFDFDSTSDKVLEGVDLSVYLDDGKGGLHLVDCSIAAPGQHVTRNHAPWAYDEAGAAQLWDLSNKLLGTEF